MSNRFQYEALSGERKGIYGIFDMRSSSSTPIALTSTNGFAEIIVRALNNDHEGLAVQRIFRSINDD